MGEKPSWYTPPAEPVEPARETAVAYVGRFMVKRAKRVAWFAAGYAAVMAVHEATGSVATVYFSR